jgi:hypothetical protein
MVGGAVARAVVLAAVLGLVGTGSASAAPAPVGNAAFARAGVEVYGHSAVGIGCETFGFCDGVAADLAASASPQYVSTRPGEAVRVTCRSADIAAVVGFFGRGDDLTTGWANATALRMRSNDPVPACGLLDGTG